MNGRPLHVSGGDVPNLGIHNAVHLESKPLRLSPFERDMFHGDAGDRIEHLLNYRSVHHGVVGIMQGGRYRDRIPVNALNLENLSTTRRHIAARRMAWRRVGRVVQSPLMDVDVIARADSRV